MGYEMQKLLSDETWEVLLKINLAIVSQLIDEKSDNSNMAELVPLLLENLFELILYSGIQKGDFFDTFSTLSWNWTHKEVLITIWCAVCQGLTKRLLSFVYDIHYDYNVHLMRSQGAQSDKQLTASINNYVVVLYQDRNKQNFAKLYNIVDEQVLYLWFRLLFLFVKKEGDCRKAHSLVNSSVNQKFSRSYIETISKILKEFSEVGKLEKEDPVEIIVLQSELMKVSSTHITPRFIQSPTFESELTSL
jgi:hypothetical protein